MLKASLLCQHHALYFSMPILCLKLCQLNRRRPNIKLNLSYYASIMLNVFRDLLCSNLCWHNRPAPNSKPSDLCASVVMCSYCLFCDKSVERITPKSRWWSIAGKALQNIKAVENFTANGRLLI